LARVSISEAARLAGISRGSLYKSYLNKGVISEQLREQVETAKDIEIKMLREQVSELKADKAFYQAQVTELTSTIKLLEAPKNSTPIYPRLWWQFWK